MDSYAQIAGRWITHKHFPQRTPVGVLGSAEWKLVRIIMAKISESNVQLQQFTKTCKRKINIQERTQILQQTCGFICSDSRTVYNSQALSTTYTRGSTRVCRMETCKGHHGKISESNVQLQHFTKTCKRKINIQERTQILQQTCGFICSDSRTVYNSQAFSTKVHPWEY